MEGIEKLELLEITKGDKKIRLYLPKFTDILNSLLTKEEVELLIQKRQVAKKTKNYVEADKIRNDLKNKRIFLVDHKDRATTWDTENYHGDGTNVFRLEFKIPKNMNVKMSYPNPTYLRHQSMELYSNPKYGKNVLVDIGGIINSFHLATDFILYISGRKEFLVNKWDDEIKTMIVHRKIEKRMM